MLNGLEDALVLTPQGASITGPTERALIELFADHSTLYR